MLFPRAQSNSCGRAVLKSSSMSETGYGLHSRAVKEHEFGLLSAREGTHDCLSEDLVKIPRSGAALIRKV
jgi:hypothetical protein